jgi:hypothetical protein
MKSLLAFAVITLAACSSSAPATPKQKANIPEPDFEIRQMVGPAELNYPEGNFEVKYRLDIGNRADVSIKLTRIEIVTVFGQGGAYALDSARRVYTFNKTIDPHQVGLIEFWAKAIGYGAGGRRQNEPVTVRGTLYYETPSGYIRQVFVKQIGQYGGDND